MSQTYTPFPYQAACLRRLRRARRRGAKRGLVVMASGLGKTVTAAFAVRDAIGREPRRMLFLCHNNDILEQARGTFEAVLGGPSGQYGYFTGREKTRHAVRYLFASFQTMTTRRTEFAPDEFAQVVVDEGHHGPAVTYRPTIEYFTPDFLLGMTATPDRTDLQDIRDIYGPEVFNLPLAAALGRGLLTNVRYELLTDELVRERLLGTADIATSRGRMRLKDLNRLFAIPEREEKLVERLRPYLAGVQNPRVIYFCPGTEYCKLLAPLVPGSVVIHSKVGTADRRDRLAAFRSGAASAVLTVDVFNEGIDVPEANVLVFLRSTASKAVFFQQLGRGLRRAEGKGEVLVLDLVGNCERLATVHRLSRSAAKARARASAPPLEMVDAPFQFHFSAAAVEVLDVLRAIRTPKTRARMIADLKRLAGALGRSPTKRDVEQASREGRCVSAGRMQDEFGSHNDALLAAGLPVTHEKVGGPTEREQMIADLQRIGRESKRTPTRAAVIEAHRLRQCASIEAYLREFGSFGRALRDAGFRPNVDRDGGTREELIEGLRRLYQRLGKAPTSADIVRARREGHGPSLQAVLRVFGTLSKALRAAGIRPGRPAPVKWTPAALTASLCRLAERLGHPPTRDEVVQAASDGNCAPLTALVAEFRSLENALRAAGLCQDVERPPRDRDAMAAFLREYARELGRSPTRRDMSKASAQRRCSSLATYCAEFGSWTNALLAAGLSPTRKQKPPPAPP